MIVWKDVNPDLRQATLNGTLVANLLWDGEAWRVLLPIMFPTEDKARAWVEQFATGHTKGGN